MPIYEYVCKKCRHEFEFLLRGEEKPECPECGGVKLGRQMSVPSGHVGGSGESACPVRGECPAPNCCGGGCGMSQFM